MRIGRSLAAACLVAAFPFFVCNLFAQESPQSKAKDYPTEPFVIEHLLNNVQFESDGTYTVETKIRVHIQSASGVQAWGLVQLPYASSTGDAEIVDISVTKPDGKVVTTPKGNVQDMPAQITVEAPFYSDLKVKQLAVKGLDVGDVLDIRETSNLRTPLIPGQFWFDHSFSTAAVILDDELEVKIPRDRTVKMKSPKLQPSTMDANGYRIYTWKTASLETKADRDKNEKETAGKPEASDKPFADVQITTFQNWNEIGQWYRQLQDARVVPTPEIRAKAEELTRGATSDDAKIRVLYGYVSSKFRYIGVAFGVGRYQPHAAADVLSNGYGDCKDKHTLLAALLASVGIKAYPALINSTTRIDPDIPAPSQFDHVITVVPQGKDLGWLDTTPEVAPFGMLMGNLRDKQALMIGSGPAQFVKTPADPPFKQSMAFHIEGKIDSSGTLEGKVDASLRGDVEVVLRNAFHRASPSQWNDVVQYVSQAWSFAGTVSDVTASSAEAAENPFSLKYTYNRKDYPNWPDVLRPPLPSANLAQLPDDADKGSEPIRLESPGEYLLDAKIELPQGVTPKARPAINITKDFAEYHATYSIDSNVVHTERHLTILLREIPRVRSAEYKDFWKAVSDDEESLIVLSSTTAVTSSSGEKPKEESTDTRVEQLIDLGNSLFSQDLDAAIVEYRQALQLRPDNSRAHLSLGDALSNKGDSDGAALEYRETLRLRPDYSEAHRDLGDILYGKEDYDGAINEYREAIRLKADDGQALHGLGNALFSKRDADGAIAAYRGALRITPDDAEAHAYLGAALESKHDLDGALAEYREALRLKPDIPKVRSTMGNLLMNRGQWDQAVEELQKAVATDPMAPVNYQLLASAYTQLHREEESLAALRFLKTLSPDDAIASGDIATILVQRKKYTEAVAELQPTVAKNPKDARLEFLLGEASIRSGDVDDGMVALRKGVELNSSPDYLNGVSYYSEH